MSRAAQRLLELYQGREDIFAERTSANGHYAPVHRPLTLDDLEAHVAGRKAIGVYPIRHDDTVTFGSTDHDNEENPEQALADAQHVRAELVMMGVATEATLLSFSGGKGYHVDVFVDQPITPGIMRRLLAVAAYRAGAECEVFPKQDTRLESDKQLGNLIKLPLAHHPKTRMVAKVLDAHIVKPESAALIHGIVARLKDEVEQAIKSVELPDPAIYDCRYGPGQREPRIIQMTRGLNRHGIRPERILELVLEENRGRFDPPHPEQYVRDKVADALKRYRADHGTAADIATRILMDDGRSADWPEPPSKAAFHGLAGEIVETLDPYTEADRAAVLVHVLVAFGNAVGARPHMMVGADQHWARVDAVIVGRTSKARKGSSWAGPRRLFKDADREWAEARIQGGLSSGEGLIHAIRDPIWKANKNGVEEIVDPGVDDKRLLAIESEFSRVLKVARRDGNILGEVVRQSWDGTDLRTMTRASPLRATGAHVSIVGHITVEELRRELTSTDQANGLANRFLWVLARRSKELPDPPDLDLSSLSSLLSQLQKTLGAARQITAMQRDAAAKALWREVYHDLSLDSPGLAGSVISRAEAQALRLSMTYALLDGSAVILEAHLRAALEVWGYCQSSAAYLFGDASGDPVEDAIAGALKERSEMTRSDISEYLGRHESATRIAAALQALAVKGKAKAEERKTAGRPAEVWVWVAKKAKEAKEGAG